MKILQVEITVSDGIRVRIWRLSVLVASQLVRLML